MFPSRSVLNLVWKLSQDPKPTCNLTREFSSYAQPYQGHVTRLQSECPSIQIWSEMFNRLNYCQELFPGNAVVRFRGSHSFAVISHHHLMTILNLRQRSPTFWSLASMSRMYSLALSGYAKMGELIKRSLRCSNACCYAYVYCLQTPIAVSRLNGWAIPAKSGMYCL